MVARDLSDALFVAPVCAVGHISAPLLDPDCCPELVSDSVCLFVSVWCSSQSAAAQLERAKYSYVMTCTQFYDCTLFDIDSGSLPDRCCNPL